MKHLRTLAVAAVIVWHCWFRPGVPALLERQALRNSCIAKNGWLPQGGNPAAVAKHCSKGKAMRK